MITLILKTYLNLILAIAIPACLTLLIGIFYIVKDCLSFKKDARASSEAIVDFSAIAGDDLLATQLDLARAYLETDKKQLAKNILNLVAKQGSQIQQKEARHLLGLL